ncbi:two component AraC family transcriptional regulator [Caballeronia peredens]|nr:two component AraC family transcriptional regulator [Caballeronia peredens]
MEKAQNITSPHQPRLLLVDDDPAMIRIIGEMLAEFPDQRFATTGESALALARESTPDLILLDANLPNMTGFDVCEILKSDAKLARVPVIFVTSHDAPALEVDAFGIGAADYVIKPLVAPRLQARVRGQLRWKSRVLQMQARARDEDLNAPVPKASGVRLLGMLADDTAHAQRDALEAIGALELAADREAALRLAARNGPSAIVLDSRCCNSPDETHMLAETVRDLATAHPLVPIVVLTDACDAHTEQQTLDAGAADVIGKPARPAVLQARMRAALATARKAQEALRAALENPAGASVHTFPVLARDTRSA